MDAAESLFERLKQAAGKALDELLQDVAREYYYIDFKISAPDKNPRRLSDSDRNNLARALSGFANSEGGVIVWGVDCNNKDGGPDRIRAIPGVPDPALLAGHIENQIKTLTVPPHQTATSAVLKPTQDGKLLVATIVPRSDLAPHMDLTDKHYYVRAGSGFEPMMHSVLAGMFGRRPNPSLKLYFDVSPPYEAGKQSLVIRVRPTLRCLGPVVADRPYLTIAVKDNLGRPNGVVLSDHCARSWEQSKFGHHQRSLLHGGLGIAPLAVEQPTKIEIWIHPPVTGDAELIFTWGCEGAAPMTWRHQLHGKEMDAWYAKHLPLVQSGMKSEVGVAAAVEVLQLPANVLIDERVKD